MAGNGENAVGKIRPPSVLSPQSSVLYYGWVLLLTLAFTELTSWGILYYGFSVFVTPMGSDLGWTRAELTGAFSLALLCSGVAGVWMGRWVDRHGPRWLMTAGSCAAALLVLAWAGVG